MGRNRRWQRDASEFEQISLPTLSRMNFRNLVQHATICFIGRRRRGKTTMAMLVAMYLALRVGRIIVFAGSKDTQEEWQNIISPMWVHGADLVKLQEVIVSISNNVAQGRRRFVEAGLGRASEYVVPDELSTLIIIDDCGTHPEFIQSNSVSELGNNGRHAGAFVLFTLQDATQMGRKYRAQMDYIGLAHTYDDKMLKHIYEECIDKDMLTFPIFRRLFKQHSCKKGSMLFIDSTNNENTISTYSNLFSYKMHWPIQWRTIDTVQMQQWEEEYKRNQHRVANGSPTPNPHLPSHRPRTDKSSRPWWQHRHDRQRPRTLERYT